MTQPNEVEAAAERIRKVEGGSMWTVYDGAPDREKRFHDDCELLAKAYIDMPTQSPSYAELTAERDHANLFARTVLSSLHWTGDGYEWTGGRFDYRMQPSEAASLTTSEIEGLRGKVKELTQKLADANAKVARVERENDVLDTWCNQWQRIADELCQRVDSQTEGGARPVRPIILGATLIESIRDAKEIPAGLDIVVESANPSEIPNSSYIDHMAIEINAVNTFARTLGYGQGELDEDLAGCIIRSYDALRDQLATLQAAAANSDDAGVVSEAWCAENMSEPIFDVGDDGVYYRKHHVVAYFAGGRCTVNVGASRIFVNPSTIQLRKLLDALAAGVG